MKPNCLTMTAFGPYKERETIDFDALYPHNLFVISGRTGAGKTTIFDGLCYALYGSASGEDRENFRSLRSDFAENEMPTSVELIFSVRGDKYRVFRQIPYLREGNKTETPGKAELFKINSDGTEIDAVDRHAINDINKKIEHLIGFSKDQFSQLVMLPQGEFRKFLTSTTENKEAIMRKIFNTEIYDHLKDELKIRRDAEKTTHITLEDRQNQLLLSICDALPTRETDFFMLLNKDAAQTTINIEQALTGLKTENHYYNNQISHIKDEYQLLLAKAKSEEKLLNDAKQLSKIFAEFDQAQNNLTALLNQDTEFKTIQREIKQGEKAQPLLELANTLVRLRGEAQIILARKNDAQRTFEAQKRVVENANHAFETENAKTEERDQLYRAIIQLQSQQATINQLQMQKEEKKQAEEKVVTQKSICAQLDEKKASLETEIQVKKGEITSLTAATQRYETLIERQVELNQHYELMQQLEQKNANFKQVKLEKTEADLLYKEKKTAFDVIASRWLQNQAALLAHTLKENEACPVCGGKEHPHKAQIHDESLSEPIYNVAQLEERSAYEKAQKITAEYQSMEARISELFAKKCELNIDEDTATLKQHLDELGQLLNKLRQQKSELTALTDSLKPLEINQTKISGEINQNQPLLQTAISELNRASFHLDKMLENIPENLRSVEAFNKELENKTILKKQLDDQWEKTQNDFKLATEQSARLETALESTTKQYETLVEEGKKAKLNLDEALMDAGFKDEAEFNSAKRDFETLENLRQQLQHYQINLETEKNNISRLEILLKEQTLPNIEQLETILVEIREQIRAITHREIEYQQLIVKITLLISNIEQNAEKLMQSEKTFGRLENLYDLIRGHNPLKISFERYIQMEYLDRVIAAANLRLLDLTNGQFEFTRSEERATHGRQSGLDIDVYDSYTGQTRDVKTMSGGEKFKASLCLSLGMADVIQSFKGGISIETLFIDEGFGSLDEESLRQAIDVLIDLQKSGRMIGVISHVEELKEVLPARIEVTKTKSGYSKTELIVQ